ncbi:hypothetical protein [Patiriisocius sp. Uisw_017]|jgi:hypothetical protein|uniref:hypothetical protein n=1 Tax=Patiriisocius sp. Uisw_017 TaxID=3230968 RepID=UPI0039E9F71B
MKKILLLIVLLITITSIAQKREENKVFEIIAKSPKLTIAKGWMKNDTSGKWVENKNVIATKKVYSFSDISHYLQNFEWIQIAKIAKDNEEYYVIIYRMVGGKYEYEGYEYLSGWTPFKSTKFLIITPAVYQLFKAKIQYTEGKDISFNAYTSGTSGKNLIEFINSYINMKKEYPRKTTFTFLFNSQTEGDKDIVRFRLGYDYITKYRQQGIYDTDTDQNLDNSYFEVSKNEFSKLLID